MAKTARSLEFAETQPGAGQFEGISRTSSAAQERLDQTEARSRDHRPRSAPRLIRVERPRLGDDPIAQHEVRDLPAQLLGELPIGATLLLEIPGHGAVAVATSADRAEEERRSGITVFDPIEWSALVTAAESDRLWPTDLCDLCVKKARAPRWTLELDVALAGARADASLGWSVGRVLDRIGAKLVAVTC